MSKPLTARTTTRKRDSVGMTINPGNFLFLGSNGNANALQSPDLYSVKSGVHGPKSYRQQTRVKEVISPYLTLGGFSAPKSPAAAED